MTIAAVGAIAVVTIPTMRAEQLFLQFRTTGDPASLGAVFDLCADDLFAVAMHLCRDRAMAEDAVQATFLIAIERAQRFRPGRPLRPWLLGILHREVKRSRRRARRVVDPARVRQNDELPPPQVALAGETRAVVSDAIANVPQPYRDVLELHLVQTLSSGAIAERLQRSPGAVRTQLWRGLELLRKLLPQDFVLGAAVGLGERPALAAVRERVVSAAGAKATTASVAGTVLIGGLLMKKVMLAAAVLLAIGVLGWQSMPLSEVRPHAAAPAGTDGDGIAASEVQIESRDVQRSVRTQADGGSNPAPAAHRVSEDVEVASDAMAVLVVDGTGEPVAEADVEVYEADAKRGATRTGSALQTRTTDVLGRARITIAGPSLVSARKDGVGWSGDVYARPGIARGAELRIVLLPMATVRGTVLGSDGQPVPGARVSGHSSWIENERSGELPAMVSDEHGRFTGDGLAGRDYSLSATIDGRYTERCSTGKLVRGETKDVVLRFPGAFAVAGNLLDTGGQPLRGKVCLVGRDGAATKSASCDAEGRFELLLTAGGSFDLIGGVEGQTSAHVPVVLDDARPRQEITLRTTPFVPVSGLVVDERGEPIAGSYVGLGYVIERDAVHELRSDLHGNLPRGPTGADGAFSFLAPAGYRYRVAARALPGSRELWVRGPTFAAPATGLVLTVRDADKQGFVLAGRVVAAADGAAVPKVRVSRITFEASGGRSSGPVGKGENGTFEIGPLAIGARCTFQFEADGFARALVGPFETGVRREEVTVRLHRCGKVRLRVQRPDGTPAIKVMASLQRTIDDPFGRAWQGQTDGDGCIEFTDVVPEAFRVHARAATEEGGRAVGDTVVRPGQTSEMRLVLRR